MPLLRIPPPLDSAAPHVEPKPSSALKTILLHLKRPVRKKKSSPDPTLLAEILGLRSLVQNLIVAASDLPEETVQRIVKHADTVKEAKAEEILKRLENLPPETK
jgi:uncharacterized tellurite resistance protein B-like protein